MEKIKVVVKNEFLDKWTGLTMKPGDTMKVTAKRLKEINRSGDYVEVEKTVAPSEPPKKEEKK